MPLLMIRYQVAEEGVEHVMRAARAAFEALEAQRPSGIRYAYYRRAGTPELIALLELDEGVENPLPAIPAARELQATVAKWVVGEPPTPQPVEVLGTYGHQR